MNRKWLFLLSLLSLMACQTQKTSESIAPIRVSDNNRFFMNADGSPFFWLGDTGWLLFTKLTREETEKYLDNRAQKGFNVIQVMVLHTLKACNVYGDSALIGHSVARPLITEGNDPLDSVQYDYWDHVDFVLKAAQKRGIHMALVPVWGSNVKEGGVNVEDATVYASWIANRYKDFSNIIWLNGGDIKGSDSLSVWNAMGEKIHATDPMHLMTFHPRGRFTSSIWFHDKSWLDFNMFQSGHRNYAQDTSKNDFRFGEDNWRYVMLDYVKIPVKPTLDGEPIYEYIPQGLHDTLMPKWTDADVRRYAYWSVFAGGCGFTYGHNSVMQFLRPGDKDPAYGAKKYWTEGVDDPGSVQMNFLKQLMLSKPYFERIPDQSLVADGQGDRYNYIVATRGEKYAFFYTYTGRSFNVDLKSLKVNQIHASWFSPKDGKKQEIGVFENNGILNFDPPGKPADGNDWVLVVDGV